MTPTATWYGMVGSRECDEEGKASDCRYDTANLAPRGITALRVLSEYAAQKGLLCPPATHGFVPLCNGANDSYRSKCPQCFEEWARAKCRELQLAATDIVT